MPTNKNFLDWLGLQTYDALIKEYIYGVVKNSKITLYKNATDKAAGLNKIDDFTLNQLADKSIALGILTESEVKNIIKYGRADITGLTSEELANLEKYGQTDVDGLTDSEKEALERAKLLLLGLHKVASSGSYNDLEDTPTVYTLELIQNIIRYGRADISGLTDTELENLEKYGVADTTPYTEQELEEMAANKLSELGLHKVAKSGSYKDLNNKPGTLSSSDITTGTEQVAKLVTAKGIKDAVDSVISDYTSGGSATGNILTSTNTTVNYDSTTNYIQLKRGNDVISLFNASVFIKDGMVSNVEISNGNLVITFNADSGKQAISIPVTDIFNANNYYTKTDVNNLVTYGTTTPSLGLEPDPLVKESDLATVAFSGKFADLKTKPTTLSGYGITDAKIANGVITLGNNTITPLTQHQDISGKVDKVSGKGLSTNDYTTDEKNKLAGIAAGAELNVQSDWNVTDTNSDAFIKNKPTIPSLNGYATLAWVQDRGYLTDETDPVFKASPAYNITDANITSWTNKQDTINDLSTIRSNAASALQPTDVQLILNIVNYGTAEPAPDVSQITNITTDNISNYTITNYSQLAYTRDTTTGNITTEGGNLTLDGTNAIIKISTSGNISGISLSILPENNHSCHLIVKNTSTDNISLVMNGNTTYICPESEVNITIAAGSYGELDLLNLDGEIFVRGI